MDVTKNNELFGYSFLYITYSLSFHNEICYSSFEILELLLIDNFRQQTSNYWPLKDRWIHLRIFSKNKRNKKGVLP